MDIKGITGPFAKPKGSLQVSREYTDTVTIEKQQRKPLDKIRDNIDSAMKGKKVDTSA